MKKIIFIILDGLGDQPLESWDQQTPLEAAKTPGLDWLASQGQTGLLVPIVGEKHPTSEEAHFALFNYLSPEYFPHRGPLEALGLGVKLSPSDVVFRVNFATVSEDLILEDPRAGRPKDLKSLIATLDKKEIAQVKFYLYPGLEHRAVLVLRGRGISCQVSSNDPHKSPPFKTGVKILAFRPLDNSEEASFTARILEEYTKWAFEVLKNHPWNKKRLALKKPPANYLLLREPGVMKKVPSFAQRYGLKACCIAGAPLYKGIGQYLGMKIIAPPGATGTPKTNLKAKVSTLLRALKEYNFLYLHIKAPDIFGEDGDCAGKKRILEKIDQAIQPLVKKISSALLKDLIVVVTGDHATPCSLKAHSDDPLPLLIYDGRHQDEVIRFGEHFCQKGALGVMIGNRLMPLLLERRKRR